jgi:hypothetical protein
MTRWASSRCGVIRNADGHRAGEEPGAMAMAVGRLWSALALAGVLLDDAGDGVAFDELALAAGGLSQGGRGDAVEVAHRAGRGLVQERPTIITTNLDYAE